MNLKPELSIVFGSPCSCQNNAMPWAACALTDHQNIPGKYLLDKHKWLEGSHSFFFNLLEKREKKHLVFICFKPA